MAALKHNGTEVARVVVNYGARPKADVDRYEKRYTFRSNRWILEQTHRRYAEDVGGGTHTTGWTRWGRVKQNVDIATIAEALAEQVWSGDEIESTTVEVR